MRVQFIYDALRPRRSWRRHRRPRRRPAATFAVVAAALSLFPARVTAQEPATLRLGDAYRAAEVNPRTAAARAQARAADARISSFTVPPDPELQVGFMNYALPDLEPMDPLGMTQIQLMQMIPTAGKLGASTRIARAQAGAERERAADVVWDVRAAVAMAFYELYQIDRGLAVARETLRLLDDIRRTAESMYRVGEGRQSDVLRAQVEVARMVEDTVRMAAMRTAAAGRLNALLDRPAGTAVGSPALPAFPTAPPPLDSMIVLAERERPMVRAGLREIDAAAARSSLARRELWPDLTIGLQYGRRNGAMGTEHMGSLMVGATVPIYARRRQLAMRDEADAMRQMAVADLAEMRADTRARVTEAHADLVRARNLAALYRATVIPQAEATVTSALSAYRVGSVDFMTLIDARMTVNEYRQELFVLEAEQGTAWAELEMLLGQQLIDPDTAIGPIASKEEQR